MEWAIEGWNGQMRAGVRSELCDGVYRFYPTVLFLSQAGGSSEG